MFGKFAASLSRVGKSKQTLKYKFEVQVLALENLPGPVKKCQIIWSRAAKTQMTSIKDAARGEHGLLNDCSLGFWLRWHSCTLFLAH